MRAACRPRRLMHGLRPLYMQSLSPYACTLGSDVTNNRLKFVWHGARIQKQEPISDDTPRKMEENTSALELNVPLGACCVIRNIRHCSQASLCIGI